MALILVVGGLLRLIAIGDVPFGFHPDEGHNALDALRIAEGWRPAFLPGNNGREPLFMAVMAVLLASFGPSIAAARSAAAVSGLAFVVAQWWFVRALPLSRPRLVALAASGAAAVTFWPVAQSRYGLRAVLLPVWLALALGAWWRATRATGATRATQDARDPRDPDMPGRTPGQGAWLWFALTGVCVAAAAYTHLTARAFPAVLLAHGLWVSVTRRSGRPLTGWLLATAVTVALMWPQIDYFRTHPDMATYRADQVSILNPEVHEGDLAGALAENAVALLLAPFLEGDSSWYHNVSDRPIFDPLLAAAFGLGAALLGWVMRTPGPRRSAGVLVLVSGAFGLAPSLLSVGAPNYVRLTAVWPALFLLAGWGLVRIASAAERRLGRGSMPAAVVTGVLAISALITVWDYFGRYAGRPEVYTAFNGQAVEKGELLRGLSEELGGTPGIRAPVEAGSDNRGDAASRARVRLNDTVLYVTPAVWRQSVIRFLNVERPPTEMDPREGLVLPPDGPGLYVFDPVEIEDAAALEARWKGLERRELRDHRGELALIVFHMPRNAWPRLAAPALVGDGLASGRPETGEVPDGDLPVFGEAVRLDAAALEPAASSVVTATLQWTVLQPTESDRNLFVHVLDPSGTTLGQFDGPPLAGSYGTHEWRPGERILLQVTVALDAAPPSAEGLRARLGWYDWRSGERLRVPGTDGNAVVIAATEGPRP